MNAIAEEVWTRNSGLGASDAAPSIGASQWRTPFQVWREKMGLATDRELEPARLPLLMGKAIEPLTLDLFTRKSGLKTTAHQRRVHDPIAPWRWVTLDALAEDGMPVEAKSAAVAYAGDWGDENEDDAVPMPYFINAQHAMGCCDDWQYIWMPLIVLNRQFRLYRIRRDEDVVRLVRANEDIFMGYVRTGTPPPAVDLEDVSAMFPTERLSSLEASVDIMQTLQSLTELKSAKKALEEQEAAKALEIKSFMGEHSALTDPTGRTLCTWKQAKASRVFDKERFRAAYPLLYAQYEDEKPGSRRLLLKK